MIDEIYTNENIAPEHEPERQFFFIKKMQEIVFAKEQEYRRKLTYHISTFGCQMNFKDSEKLAGVLEEIGFVEVDDEKADFCLYNTCTVRENANSRVYGRLGYLGKLKSRKPDMIIAMCGCMMQEEHVVETIKKSYRFVDIIFGTHNIYKLAELLFTYYVENAEDKKEDSKKSKKKHKMVVDILKGTDRIVEELPSKLKASFKAGINIMFGCNNFCTYCIVPYVRGRERSRKPEDIINEIKDFVSKGVIEVMLLGQNVNSYGKNLDNPISFAELLKQVDEIEGLKRIRFMTSHPKDLSDELIEVMKNSKKVCHHIHLPVQSGSSRLLKKMNRVYTKEDYLKLIDKIRVAIPDIAITTDIIVGFPGETEEDFEETLDVVRYAKYASAFTFIYSKRTGTPAASFPDQVDEATIKERFDRLLKEVNRFSEEYAKSLEGKVMPVLVEERDREVEPDKNYLTGRLDNNLLVHFEGSDDLIGQIIDVKLSECKGFYYIGEKQF
ncbi:MAG: tRNA (N6-isopentenyl adenosine(37)-C2)-methylthiotransferase MiaB [Lachnospiraceae bacterium]|nr:tRNA (N6-isopentenyl adenosine(37)-C2)-methylthiotransferase MiaB [Lachnospiraceae bacterium]